MIYIFDKTQAIIKVLTNDDFTAAHLNFKINTATTFEFSLPASKALPSGSKYVATPHPLNDSKFIMLRLTERVDNTETIDYSAYELAYQELATDGYIEDKRPQNQSALNLMKIALDGSNWELNNVNVSGAATTNFYYVDRLSAISKVVDLLGGEIVFYIEIQGNAISGRYMDYLARQVADTSKVFASGSNLLTVERQSDTSGIYTAILPRGKGEEIDNGDAGTPDGYGRRINIADVEWKKSSGNPLDKPKGSIVLSDPDATAEWGQINGNARLLLQTYDDIDDVNVLINSAYKTLQSVNHPQIQYSATVADVGGLSLGDTVLIMHGDRDLSYKTRVFEVKYDLLSPDQTELSLGDDLSSNNITSQINNLNAVADTTSSQTQWTINQIGRPGTTYGATAPNSPKVGDIWFKYLADGGTEIYRWNGDIWELLASPTTADDIAAAVDDAVAQAKAHVEEVKQGLSTDISTARSEAVSQANAAITQANTYTATAIEQNNASQQEVMSDVAKSQADLAIKDGDFNNKAQAMADKALSDAKSEAASLFSTANSQAASLANTAQQNAIDVASKSLGTYLVRLSPGTNIFKTTNSTTIQAQVWKAGQDITSTLDNASFSWKLAKDGTAAISLTNNVKNVTAKTSDFDSTGTYIVNVIIPVTDTTGTTRNQTFSDSTTIAKVSDGVNGATGNGISSTTITYATSASGTNAPTSGYTSTIPTVNKGQFLWQRTATSYTNGTTKNSDVVTYFAKDGLNGVDGIDGGQGMIAQPSKPTSGLVDGFLWLDTSQTYPVYYVYDSSIKDFKIYQFNAKNINADQIKAKFVGTYRLSASQIIADDLHVKSANIDGRLTASQITVSSTNGSQTSLANFNLGEISQTISDTKSAVDNLSVGGRNLLLGTANAVTGVGNNSFNDNFNAQGGEYHLAGGKRLSDIYNQYGSSGHLTISFDWVASGSTISGTFNSQWNNTPWGTLSNGSISPSNSNLSGHYEYTVSLGTNGFSTSAADAVAFRQDNLQGNITISNLKLESGNKATDWTPAPEDTAAAVSQVSQKADSISNFVRDSSGNISSEFQTALSKTSIITDSNDKFSTLQQRADGFDATVTKVDNLAAGGRNLYLNSKVLADGYGTNGSAAVTVEPFDSTTNMWHIVSAQSSGTSIGIYLYNYGVGKIPDNSDWSYSADIKGTGKIVKFGIETDNNSPIKGNIGSEWSRISQTGRVGDGIKTIVMYFDTTDSLLDVYIKLPKLETGNLPTAWTPAPEDVDSKISTVSQNVDRITNIVSDPTTGLSIRVQTAEGTLSKVTGVDIPKLQNATFWQPYSSLNFNDYIKQGSFFFNTTAAKTNGPTTSNGWLYLIVEQGTADNSRIKQTAWYDGVTGVKITYVRTRNDGTWSPWYANDNDSVTTISQTNSDIKQEISDRKTGDSNTLQSSKEFTQSKITSYNEGMQSQLTQTSDAILAKVGATNLFPNSEFEKDYGYRQLNGNTSLSLDHKDLVDGRLNGTVQVVSTANDWQGYWARSIPVYGGQKYSMSVLVHYENGGLSNGYAGLDIRFVDKDGNRINSGEGGNSATSTGQVSSPFWVKLYSEGITAPINATHLEVSLIVANAGAGQTAVFTQPMVTATEKLQGYTPNDDINTQLSLLKDNWSIGIKDNVSKITSGIVGDSGSMSLISKNIALDGNTTFNALKKTADDTNDSVSQVKNTADSISNFVRDSSGNLSVNFQTALSKASLISDSTFATSIKTQTATQISSALMDNNGKIISLINQDSSGVQIAGKNIVLDGNTTVTGDFYAKGGHFTNLNASNILIGTLNGDLINITNINAGNIVSGSISGANLNINLNTGQVVFQHGRIYNTSLDTQGGIDINIDNAYISTKDYLGYSTLANGGLYLSQTRLNDPGYKPYFSIENNNTPFGTLGALLLGTNGVAIATEGNSMPTPIGREIYNGLLVTKGKQTVVAGSSNGVMISGGKEFGDTNPFINVGATNMIAGTGGDRIQVYANYFHLPLQWSTTTSNGANMYISLDGAIVRSSSSSKYKLDIEYEQQAETANRLLTLDPATWHDKFESKQLDKFHEIGVDPERTIDMSNRRYYGIIAEDLVKAGLEHLVSRNVETGEVEGVEYSKIGVALIPIVRDLRNRLNDQNVEIERLKEKIK
ncbi:phage tail spike protein [Leuconostoc gasicomitatum]|uniref:phage tail spike protein n=1 Tax=Leuconostoc gasicomitatum TaxID=115778 RepID=UPI001CC5BE16|nr:phage tail spike protein [Leuconostoc gasicomitatum]MBZ5949270.1 phage tail protein [Leuconostoc gasicomitatum]